MNDVNIRFPRGEFPLHAMISSAGYADVKGEAYSYYGMKRGNVPFVLLQHTISGRGHLSYEGRRYDLTSGKTMLLCVPQRHHYWLGKGDHWEHFWLCMSGREVRRVWREVLYKHGPVVTLLPDVVERLAAICLALLKNEANTPVAASSFAYSAAMEVAGALFPWEGQDTSGTRVDAAIIKVLSAFTSHPPDRLDINAMADVAGYSRYHFMRVFSERMGTTPARYLADSRMHEAARWLLTDQTPVKFIAERCGYSDANYFSKAFRRKFGLTPTEYRNAFSQTNEGKDE
ncbi:AraC family transcriptional regulator [Agrobacterium tumefaciens]|nr:AraC family transcriptional regulator [Agrobacterium tumefaciens]